MAEELDWECKDCGVDTRNEYYMVHDSIWKSAGLPLDGGLLCVSCLEQRLGRGLIAADFTSYPVNIPHKGMSAKLLSRLSLFRQPRTFRDALEQLPHVEHVVVRRQPLCDIRSILSGIGKIS